MTLLSLNKATTVYIACDQAGRVIYVGITSQGPGRNGQHQKNSEWWGLHDRMVVEHFPTRQTALLRERELIRTHRPPFNKQHNANHERIKAAYLAEVKPLDHGPKAALDLADRLGWAIPLKPTVHGFQAIRFESDPAHLAITTNWIANRNKVFDEDGVTVGSFTASRAGLNHLVQFSQEIRYQPSCGRVLFSTAQTERLRFYITSIELSYRWPAPWLGVAA
jgi:predicted GIY-YIG superfamily endonuclease